MAEHDRRQFITTAALLMGAGCLACVGGARLLTPRRAAAADGNLDACFDGQCGRRIFGEKLPFEWQARFWQPLDGSRVQCVLCPYDCVLKDGERCRCNGKENHGGKLYDMLYGNVATLHLDSVEKLPLYHSYPGIKTLALGTAGCGLHCKYCQNSQLSQVPPERAEHYRLPPQDIVALARSHGLPAIALGYTEPLTFYEFSYDIARAARQAGLKVFMGTGGFANVMPVREIAPHLDGVAFGLKGFSDAFYDEVIAQGVKLDQILASLEAFAAAGTHLEVANLIVPTKNDDPADVSRLAQYVKRTLGADTPLHLLKFFPHYQLKQLPPTSQSTLERAAAAARAAGLNHVYIGNLPGHSAGNTYCTGCGALLVQRIGFRVLAVNLDGQGRCAQCGATVPGRFTPHFITT